MYCVQDEESRELAVICLQQVMRGRLLQKTMFDGKEKRVELIREMRSTHALRAAEQQLLQDEKQATELLQQQQQMNETKVRADCLASKPVSSSVQGSISDSQIPKIDTVMVNNDVIIFSVTL